MGQLHDAVRRRVGAEHVGHMGDCDQPDRTVPQQRLERRHIQLAGVGDRCNAQRDAMRVAQHLPGHQVGMVLHGRDHHGLARPHHAATIAVGKEVDRLGAVAGEHDLAAIRRVHQRGNGVARAFISLGGAFAHPVQAAMDVRVLRLHRAAHGIDHRTRLLCRGGAVQKHQRKSPHGLAEDGKVLANARNVQYDRANIDVHAACLSHQASTLLSSTARAPP